MVKVLNSRLNFKQQVERVTDKATKVAAVLRFGNEESSPSFNSSRGLYEELKTASLPSPMVKVTVFVLSALFSKGIIGLCQSLFSIDERELAESSAVHLGSVESAAMISGIITFFAKVPITTIANALTRDEIERYQIQEGLKEVPNEALTPDNLVTSDENWIALNNLPL
ncbi:hypothetical protein HZH66_000906 [Vespula vulgaris]|uniref:Uncharacterized protein n=1 Tax=Vespula vulgaris TaxID=7454 RepID=A0A834NK65_VESVU|nr:hypothetical protein HZH66_000906 [Vespula vulgaris]